MLTLRALAFTLSLLTASAFAESLDLAAITSPADLETTIAATREPELKAALQQHSAAILTALAQLPHVEAVTRTVESAQGKVEKINLTPESLKKASGGDLTLFTTLKLVDLAVPNTGPHDHRKNDPYDRAFFVHLGHLATLESLNIISTKLDDEWIAPLAGLVNLKSLRFTNNGKLTDAGLAKLAGLKNLEAFSFVGTGMQGHAFAQFEGWTRLTRCSFRGSSIDDEGLGHLCDRFPNLESISLAHAKFTDAGAPHLAKLTKLKGLEIGTSKATPAALQYLSSLPIEYLQLGEGFDSSAALVAIKDQRSLRRLTLTNCAKMTDDDLQLVAAMSHLQSLELGNVPITEERIPQFERFKFLTFLRLVKRPQPHPEEIQAKLKALLPKVQLTFQ